MRRLHERRFFVRASVLFAEGRHIKQVQEWLRLLPG
jgi:hypothetical protein